jgi:hypothetical protein
LTWASCQKKVLLQKLNVLFEKLENAKHVHNKIQELKTKPAFMTDEEIKGEKTTTKKIIKEPLKINAKITELRNSNEFLDNAQILELKSRIYSLKSTLKKDNDNSDDDDQHKDLECVICKSLPNYVNDPVDKSDKRFKNSSKIPKMKSSQNPTVHLFC